MAIRKADRQTLQAIATIALNPSKDHKRKVTLVVVTLALLGQWHGRYLRSPNSTPSSTMEWTASATLAK